MSLVPKKFDPVFKPTRFIPSSSPIRLSLFWKKMDCNGVPFFRPPCQRSWPTSFSHYQWAVQLSVSDKHLTRFLFARFLLVDRQLFSTYASHG